MKILAVVRDVVVIAGVVTVCALLVTERQAQQQDRREAAARGVKLAELVSTLEKVYKDAVFDSDNKGIYHQIFRQNEILIEYQKLLLTAPYLVLNAESAAKTIPARK